MSALLTALVSPTIGFSEDLDILDAQLDSLGAELDDDEDDDFGFDDEDDDFGFDDEDDDDFGFDDEDDDDFGFDDDEDEDDQFGILEIIALARRASPRGRRKAYMRRVRRYRKLQARGRGRKAQKVLGKLHKIWGVMIRRRDNQAGIPTPSQVASGRGHRGGTGWRRAAPPGRRARAWARPVRPVYSPRPVYRPAPAYTPTAWVPTSTNLPGRGFSHGPPVRPAPVRRPVRQRRPRWARPRARQNAWQTFKSRHPHAATKVVARRRSRRARGLPVAPRSVVARRQMRRFGAEGESFWDKAMGAINTTIKTTLFGATMLGVGVVFADPIKDGVDRGLDTIGL